MPCSRRSQCQQRRHFSQYHTGCYTRLFVNAPLLYSFRRCPYAMRARLALAYAGVTVRVHEVHLRHKPPEMLAVSPKGTVPVLVLPSGSVLEQSLEIMQWALQQHDPHHWWQPGPEADAWLARNDGPFKHALNAYKYPEKHPSQPAAAHRQAAVAALIAPLQAQLGSHAYVLGASVSYVDAALLPFVRQFAAVDRAWFDDEGSRTFPQVVGWLHAWLASDLLVQVMAKPDPNSNPNPNPEVV